MLLCISFWFMPSYIDKSTGASHQRESAICRFFFVLVRCTVDRMFGVENVRVGAAMSVIVGSKNRQPE